MLRYLVIAVLLVVATTATAPAPAAAQESGVFDDLTETIGDALDALIGAARGEYRRLVDEPADRDVQEAVDDLQAEFNANSDDLEAWANSRSTATTDQDVVELEFEIDGETATTYLVADVDGSNYANTSLVDTTNRTVDESCELEGTAARNAADELESFIEAFVEDDRDVTRGYLARLSRQYRGEVDCSFLTDT